MLSICCILAFTALAKALTSHQRPNSSSGFLAGSKGFSAGKHAECYSGLVPIGVSSQVSQLALRNPVNQTVLTEIIQELEQADSTIAAKTIIGQSTLKATYNIETTLCIPADATLAAKLQTVQVLTYGIGLDKSYWDIAPGYSYVDAAAAAGYATVAYNRLGVGKSSHPDPIQAVQSTTDVEILHGLVSLIRAGSLGSKPYKFVVGVGQSYGSIVQLAQTAKYPNDVDAAVLTSFTSSVANLPSTVLANNPSIARINDPSRFGGLQTGYIVHDTAISVQLPFFRHPYFDPKIFDTVYAEKQTYSLGQQFTLPAIYTPAPAFKGPIDIVVGQHDFPFCAGNCLYPTDLVAATKPALWPAAAAGSETYIVPNVGHFINAHYGAQQAFDQITKFLRSNNF